MSGFVCILASIPDNMPATGAVYLLNFPAAHTAGLRYVTRRLFVLELLHLLLRQPPSYRPAPP